jgi:hypothetical protein
MSVEKLVEHFSALEDPRCAGRVERGSALNQSACCTGADNPGTGTAGSRALSGPPTQWSTRSDNASGLWWLTASGQRDELPDRPRV